MILITATHLDEYGEEKCLFERCFETADEANAFMDEQDFADNPEIYAVYRKEI